jgi:hypothetical protein
MLNAHCQLIDACLLVCLFLVLENAWELTRRMYHRKKMIQVSEGDKLKREKFVESFKRTRPNHKNFKPKRESKLDDSESATSSNTATDWIQLQAAAIIQCRKTTILTSPTHSLTL